MPQHVQHHGEDHAVGGVAVNAAHDAAGPPLVVGDALNRLKCVVNAGVGKNIKIKPGAGQQPELPEADGAQMVERIQFVAEGNVEYVLHAHEKPAHDLLKKFDHYFVRSGRWGEPRRVVVYLTGGLYWKKRPPLSGLKSITMTCAGLSTISASLTKLKPGLIMLSFIRTDNWWVPAFTSKRLYTVETPSL